MVFQNRPGFLKARLIAYPAANLAHDCRGKKHADVAMRHAPDVRSLPSLPEFLDRFRGGEEIELGFQQEQLIGWQERLLIHQIEGLDT